MIVMLETMLMSFVQDPEHILIAAHKFARRNELMSNLSNECLQNSLVDPSANSNWTVLPLIENVRISPFSHAVSPVHQMHASALTRPASSLGRLILAGHQSL